VAVSFVYVLACRLFELVVLLGRGERSKELEILVLRHELVDPAAAGEAAAVCAARPDAAGRAEPGAAASLVEGVLGEAGDAAGLASAAGRQTLDVPTAASRATPDRRRGARAGPAAGAREHQLGLPADRRRAAQARD
jgi:hypothetical protein